MKVRIKKLVSEANIPVYAKTGDAGLDFTATSKHYDNNGNVIYGCGVAVEIPVGYVGLLFPRSSVSKTTLALSNAVGIIDSGYRGEIMCKFKLAPFIIENDKEFTYTEYNIGDRVCQMIILPYPQIEFEEVGELSLSERGEGGYGSTGS